MIALSHLVKRRVMNHIYKTSNVGWADEESSSSKHSGKMRCSVLHQPILPIALLACFNAYALPTGNQLVAGQATVAKSTATQMQINQASDRAVINWQGFSV